MATPPVEPGKENYAHAPSSTKPADNHEGSKLLRSYINYEPIAVKGKQELSLANPLKVSAYDDKFVTSRTSHRSTKFVNYLPKNGEPQSSNARPRNVPIRFRAPRSSLTKPKREPKREPKRTQQSSSTLSSASVETPGAPSGAQSASQDALVVASRVPLIISDCGMYGLPVGFSAQHRRALRSYMEILPSRIYAFERFGVLSHNPMRVPDTYRDLVANPMAMSCAVVIGNVCETMRPGRVLDTAAIMNHVTISCSIINRHLSNRSYIGGRVPELLIQAIAMVSLCCHVIKYYDQWYVHITGLKELVRVCGGLSNISPPTRWLIHSADLIASSELAMEPVFEAKGDYYPFAPDFVQHDRSGVRMIAARSLSVLCKEVRTFTMLYNMLLYMHLIFSGKFVGTDDPNLMMNSWYHGSYELLTVPEPIRELKITVGKSIQEMIAECSDPVLCGSVGRDLVDCVQCILRLSFILYHSENIRPLLGSKWVNDVPFALHHHYLRTVLGRIRGGVVDTEMTGVTLPEDGQTRSLRERGLAISLRSVLIWCILTTSFISDNMQQDSVDMKPLGDPILYHDLIIELVGLDLDGVDCIPESELDLYRILPWRNTDGSVVPARLLLQNIVNLIPSRI